jgi:hypothetical protein
MHRFVKNHSEKQDNKRNKLLGSGFLNFNFDPVFNIEKTCPLQRVDRFSN